MKLRFTFLLATIASATAFTSNHIGKTTTKSSTLLNMADVSEGIATVPVTITGNNIELTPALIDYVKKKLDRPLGKLSTSGNVVECDVHLSVNKNPRVEMNHRIDVTTKVVGTTFHSQEETADMYTSIDNVAARLSRKLIKYKERRVKGWHGGNNMEADLAKALSSLDVAGDDTADDVDDGTDDDYVDPEAPVVTRVKSFDLAKPESLKEAIFALDYVDHDFYVFRNSETDDINVVYKRNTGGIGLIEPEQ